MKLMRVLFICFMMIGLEVVAADHGDQAALDTSSPESGSEKRDSVFNMGKIVVDEDDGGELDAGTISVDFRKQPSDAERKDFSAWFDANKNDQTELLQGLKQTHYLTFNTKINEQLSALRAQAMAISAASAPQSSTTPQPLPSGSDGLASAVNASSAAPLLQCTSPQVDSQQADLPTKPSWRKVWVGVGAGVFAVAAAALCYYFWYKPVAAAR